MKEMWTCRGMAIVEEKTVLEVVKDLLRPIRNNTRRWLNYNVLSVYGQCGEDKLLAKLMNKKNGFYVDVGANHPIHLNNTYKFYKKGWRGINIDPIKSNIDLLKKIRPIDKNLLLGVSNVCGEQEFFVFNDNALSTFSKELAESWVKNGYKVVSTVKVKLVRLEDVFEKYGCEEIDLLSVDVEGMDLQVLKSNNWDKFKPTFICLEVGNSDLNRVMFKKYLIPRGYRVIGDTGINIIFKIVNNSNSHGWTLW